MNNILVLCIGNICRSPMAEALLRYKLQAKGARVSIQSAGLHALVGHAADPFAQELMNARGLDISGHRAKALSSALAFSADLILTMDGKQQQMVEHLYPALRGRVFRLGRWSDADIVDPYKRSKAFFEKTLLLIEQGVDEWNKVL